MLGQGINSAWQLVEALAVLLALVFLVGFPVIAVVALVKARRGAAELRKSGAAVGALSSRLDDITADLTALRAHLGVSYDADSQSPQPEPVPDEEAPAAPEPKAEAEAADEDLGPWYRTPGDAEAARTAEPDEPAPPKGVRASLSAARFEEAVMSRWLVWLGAVTIALGGVFLVRYAVEHGLLGPAARTSLGLLAGIALAIGGEWLRHRPMQRAIAAIRPDYVPPALTASGLFVAFASIYVAYALHDLIAPLVAFVLLAGVALIGVGLALVQGWFVALLGLLGAFVTPALVRTDDPFAWALFPYLLIIAAACLAVARRVERWWLSLATLIGVFAWPLLWFDRNWSAPDVVPIGLFILLVTAAFLATAPAAGAAGRPDGWSAEIRSLPPSATVAWVAPCLLAVVVFALVRMDAYGTPSLVFLVLFAGLLMLTGWVDARFDGLAVIALALVLCVMAAWHLPEIITGPEPFYWIEGRAYGRLPGPIVPPELARFATAEAVFGALFAGAGFAALWRARRPVVWAGVSAAAPIGLLVIAFWRIVGFGVDLGWATAALALAAISLVAAARLEAGRSDHRLAAPLGFYAAAVVAFVSLGMAMTLREAWLTVALALQLPALGWIATRLPTDAIRKTAMIVAAIIVVRLVFNYRIFDYALGAEPLFGWVLYGYGIPAVACWGAARLFRRTAVDSLIVMLEAASLAFAVLFATLEIRLGIEGSLDSPGYGLLEQSLQTIAWMSIAYALAVADRRSPQPVSLWGSRILLGLALAQIVFLQLWYWNPIWRVTFVGEIPILNVLLLAYAIPAVFCFGFAREQMQHGNRTLARLLGALGLVLIFAYLSLEVRRTFHGGILLPFQPSDVELYVYSLVWLIYSASLLGLAILRRIVGLRHASFVFLLITIVKVFVFDMADLTGLLRVASFIGLGLSLVAVGFVYQRFVFTQPPASEAARGGEDPAY